MDSDTTNLLPPERLEALRRHYFLRLATLGVFLLLAAVLVHAVLLFATHVLLTSELAGREAELRATMSSVNAADAALLEARLAALSADARALAALPKAPSASALLRALLALPRMGITLERIDYEPPGKGPGTLAVSGVARDRDALRAYDATLTAAPFALKVDLPVGAYASESNINFTTTVTLSAQPVP